LKFSVPDACERIKDELTFLQQQCHNTFSNSNFFLPDLRPPLHNCHLFPRDYRHPLVRNSPPQRLPQC
uniref:TLE_N domain-containing protein n=1 Tax=Schistocephalus solidus TaxID=70667 RepID=A0A183S8F9_SCHSO